MEQAGLRYPGLDLKIEEILTAIGCTRVALDELERGLATAREEFRSGIALADWQRGETVDVWLDFQDVLVDLQSALSAARREAYRAAAVDDGLSFSEIATITGRARQVVTRLVKSVDADAGDDQTD